VDVMSLTEAQREGTRRELRHNLELCELAPAAIAVELAFTGERLAATLEVTPEADPVDVWMLRDFLEDAVRRAGGRPEHYTVLTETSRADAERWFGLPRRP
jgi:hypothetical protein